MNIVNYKKVLEHIEANPACWKQDTWHCGTQHCFAGVAQILSGKEPSVATVRLDAIIFLGLTDYEAGYFFASHRTLADFRDGYDAEGYNRDGFNAEGYGRDGYLCQCDDCRNYRAWVTKNRGNY